MTAILEASPPGICDSLKSVLQTKTHVIAREQAFSPKQSWGNITKNDLVVQAKQKSYLSLQLKIDF